MTQTSLSHQGYLRLKQGKFGHTEGIYDLQEAYDGDNLCLQTLSSVSRPH